MEIQPLVTKFLLGHADVCEAPLRCRPAEEIGISRHTGPLISRPAQFTLGQQGV